MKKRDKIKIDKFLKYELPETRLQARSIWHIIKRFIKPDNYAMSLKKKDKTFKSLSELQQEIVISVVKINDGNIEQSAKDLKISRSTVYRKIEKDIDLKRLEDLKESE